MRNAKLEYWLFFLLPLPISVTTLCICRGYLAPEYALLGQLTKKADVYSFGVVLLEIISGRSSSKAAFGEELLVLVEWVSFLTFIISFFFVLKCFSFSLPRAEAIPMSLPNEAFSPASSPTFFLLRIASHSCSCVEKLVKIPNSLPSLYNVSKVIGSFLFLSTIISCILVKHVLI